MVFINQGVYIKSKLYEMPQLWKHRMNKIQNAIQALESGYDGIEVDFHYHNGSFWMHHDHFYLTDETMKQLFKALEKYNYRIWIDLKTVHINPLPELINLLNTNNMLNRYIIELNNITWKVPDNINYMFCYPSVDAPKNLCKHVNELTKDVIEKSTKPLYVYGSYGYKPSCKLGMLKEKDILLQNLDRPTPYPSCDTHFNILLILLILICILSLRFLK